MTKLYLTRHGETVDNVNQRLQGQTQGELSDHGRMQARQLSERMADVTIDCFLASDLWRAVETCRIIADSHGKMVETTPLLRERDWGDFTGEFIPALKDKTWPANIESLEHLKARARQFLDLMSVKYAGQTVLAVGHGIINKAIQSVFHDKPMNEIQKMENAEVREIILP